MRKLNNKVFLTIFLILSSFLIVSISIYNIGMYKREYQNIYRSLTFIDAFNPARPLPRQFNNYNSSKEIDDMVIVDYEVYTVKLKNKEIDKIIGHSDSISDFDVESIALSIIDKNTEIRIGNLYTNSYAYNYTLKDTIVIVNMETINKKMQLSLLLSLIILILVEIVIYIISKLITKWIVKPAIESFDKQKNFIADASHELKTPLAIIMASSDELKSDKKNTKYIENIKYESERMNKLITSLLDLSKLESENTINDYKEENISKIIEKISLTFESIAFEQNVSIKTNIEKNIMFNCNKEEIEKLISIILDNAIKHSYKDSKVLVKVEKEKSGIDIEIINTGDPIKEEDEEKIFERFYRGDKSRNRNANRYGLGLAIAKAIVTNNNGTIRAFSKDNKTTFKIFLKK